jgi:hypothetical protein
MCVNFFYDLLLLIFVIKFVICYCFLLPFLLNFYINFSHSYVRNLIPTQRSHAFYNFAYLAKIYIIFKTSDLFLENFYHQFIDGKHS